MSDVRVGDRERVATMDHMVEDSIAEPGGPSDSGLATLDRELEELLENQVNEPGDHERFSHYVRKEQILESAVTGKPVTALCGKKWTPNRDPKPFPVCPECKKIYEGLPDEA